MCVSGSPNRSTHDGELHLIYFCIFSIIFVSCFAVVFRLVGLLSNMSFIFIFVVSSSCIPVHVSRTCSCDSKVSVHLLHLVSLYFPLKSFFTSRILVLALKMVDASILFNSFMYFGRSPAFQFVFSRRNCIFVFPRLFFLHVCCVGSIFSVVIFVFWYYICRVSLIVKCFYRC